MIKVTENQANQIYQILVEEVGCPKDWHAKRPFMDWLTSPQYREIKDHDGRVFRIEKGREYRIGGKLGYGGKFWNNNGRLYVNCYREDEDLGKLIIIEKVNRRLEEFYA